MKEVNIIRYTEVFTPGTIPEATYNKRQEMELESQLLKMLDIGGKIAVITGQTKIGKTVLVRKVVSSDKRVEIQPSDIKDDLEVVIAKALKYPVNSEKIESLEENDRNILKLTGEFSGGVSFFDYLKTKLGISSEIEKNNEKNSTLLKTFEENLFHAVVQSIIEEDRVLIFDDFHYLDTQHQKKIIHKLKDPISRGLKVVVILIPNRGEDIITAEKDMDGRTRIIDLLAWTEKELRYIPEIGFPLLNIQCNSKIIDHFVENSFNNPFLMQDICANFCYQIGATEKVEKVKNIEMEDVNFYDLYSEVSDDNQTLLDRIERGKATKGKRRKEHALKGEKEYLDIYQLIVKALGEHAHKKIIDMREFVTTIQSYLEVEDDVRKSDVVGTLNRMVEIAKEDNKLEPVIDYHSSDERIVMNNPFFQFTIRWRNRAHA